MITLTNITQALALLLSLTASIASGIPKSPWPQILLTLNQEPGAHPRLERLDDDLLALYKAELKAIDDAWSKTEEGKRDKKLMESKRLANVFYHEHVQELNDQAFAKLNQDKPVTIGKDYFALGESVLKSVRSNPVARLESSQSFDPSGQLGFCFGRALLVHYELLKAGVKQEDLGKVFVAGQLRVGAQMWNFHVAVVALDSKKNYLVIDPLLEKPVSLSEWRAITSAYDIKGSLSRARFYVTDPRKFLPATGRYSLQLLTEKHLKKYFDELALSMKSRGQEMGGGLNESR